MSLDEILSVKDLGIICSHDLCFCEHIECIIEKSSKALGFIKSLLSSSEFSDPRSIIKALYTALVRSIMEYGSIIWNPYTNLESD